MTQDIRVNQINSNRVVLSIDAMGGDLGAPAVIAGIARSAAKNPNLHFILHGPEDELQQLINRRRRLKSCVKIVNTTDVINMSDKPSQVVRSGKNSSMWSALEYVEN
jgi:glycerol-3-phosphate acyltransferase PlsX